MFLPYFRSLSNRQPANQLGFGLIELIVSISILIIITSVVLVNQSSFNSAILLRGHAYELALQLRTAQLNAVSASDQSGSGTFRSVFGVHFNTAAGSNSQYQIFRDADADYYYDMDEEFGQQGVLDSRFEIREIRANGVVVGGGEASVVFERPNFDARFFEGPGTLNELLVGNLEVDIARRGVVGVGPDVLRTVTVTSAGQISVQ